MKQRFEFAGSKVPGHLKLFQLTDDPDVPSCHIYMEAQIFSPDSKRFVLHRSAHPHGSDPNDPEHRYLLCDLENDGALTELTSEPGVTAPALSPDGNMFYYFRNRLTPDGGSIHLMRCKIDGTERQELMSVGQNDGFSPSGYFYPLSTISADGERLAVATSLAGTEGEDGYPEHALWIFDLKTGKVHVPVHGKEYCNLHMQYCRSPEHARDIMIQHNHGCRRRGEKDVVNHSAALDDASGFRMRRWPSAADPAGNNTGFGVDIHCIRDDGTALRSYPWGRDGVEFCQGHQCWRGDTEWSITSTLLFTSRDFAFQELIESLPLPDGSHDGNNRSGGRNLLSRGIDRPHFLHFATDRKGEHIVSDYESENGEWHLYLGTLGAPGRGAADLRFLLNLGSREQSPWHPHPFLSPDGKFAFFNSSESGRLQAYALALR